jgi:eukaryotic-like serine/threonine-protein kinase
MSRHKTPPTGVGASSKSTLVFDGANAEPSVRTRSSPISDRHQSGHRPSEHVIGTPATADVIDPLQYRDHHRYEFISEHGRGGIGRVYRAHDNELLRDVALKELLQSGGGGEVRFLREALITARLEHPGIVPVHDAGRWPDGTPFYTMKLVAGQSLSQLLTNAKSSDQRLALLPSIIAVSDALAYAHDCSIIHRDIKPSNVIVGKYGENIVIDWGICKDLSASISDDLEQGPYRTPAGAELTVTGSTLGTPAYMAPEQARGEKVDTRADVYSLGAMLFQICTGEPPPSNGAADHLSRALRGVHEDLAAIALKALSFSPSDRYQNASAFAADLKAFDAGARISARKYSLAAILWHWIRHHKRIALSITIPTTIAILIGLVSLREIIVRGDREVAAKREAIRERNRAIAAARDTRERSNELLLHQAEVLLAVNPTKALALANTYPLDGADRQRSDVVKADAISRGVATTTIDDVRLGLLQGLIWTADDSLAAYGVRNRLVFLKPEGHHKVSSIELSRFTKTSITENRDVIAFQRRDGEMVVRRLQSSAEVYLGRIEGTTWDLEISPAGTYVAASSSSGLVQLWRVEDRALSVFKRTPGVYQALRFSPAESELASCERDGTMTIWSTATKQMIRGAQCEGIANIDFQFCGTHLLAGSRTGNISGYPVLRNGRAPEWRTSFDGPVNFIRPISDTEALVGSVSGDLARISCDSGVVVWHTHLKRNLTQLLFSKSTPKILALAGHGDGSVSAVDSNGHVSAELRADASAIVALATSPDSNRLAAASTNGVIRIWQLAFPLIHSVALADAPLFHIRFSPDGEYVATESQDGRVYVCTRTGLKCETKMRHRSLAYGLEWSPDGKLLGSSGWDGQVRFWSRPVDLTSILNTGAREVNIYLRSLPGDSYALIRTPELGWAIWDVRTATASTRVSSIRDVVSASGDGGTIAVLSESGVLSLSRFAVGRLHSIGAIKLGPVIAGETRLELSRTGRYGLYVPNEDNVVLLDMSNPSSVRQYRLRPGTATGRVFGLSFDLNEENAVISYENGLIVRLRLGQMAAFDYKPFDETPFVVSVKNNVMAAATLRGKIWVFDLRRNGRHCVVNLDEDTLMDADLSPDGTVFAAVSKAGWLRVLPIKECRWVDSSIDEVRRDSSFRMMSAP